MEWYEVLISILTGLSVTIPLVVKLVEYVKKAVQERNWGKLVALVMRLMQEAEEEFDNGTERKTWVMGMIEASADLIDYDIDMNQVSELIDDMCALSKVVNAPKIEE